MTEREQIKQKITEHYVKLNEAIEHQTVLKFRDQYTEEDEANGLANIEYHQERIRFLRNLPEYTS